MKYIRTLNQVQFTEHALFGSRACDLAHLMAERLPVPQTFVLTAEAWDAFIQKNNIQYKIDFILQQVDFKNERTLLNAYNSIRKLILHHPVPDEVLMELKDAYESLGQGVALNEMMREDNAPFATMMSSPTYAAEAESFEGIIQNVHGLEQVQLALKEIYAMAYTPDALLYRDGLGERDARLAVIVQSMPGATASATAYSTDPEQQDMVFVHAYQGYPDVREVVAKDFFHVKKEFLNVAASQIVEQSKIIVRSEDNMLYPVEFHEGRGQSLNDKEVQEVARLAKKSEKVLGGPTKSFFVLADDKYFLLYANRYQTKDAPTQPQPVEAYGEAVVEEVPSVEAVIEEPVQEAVEIVPEPVEEPVVEVVDQEPVVDEPRIPDVQPGSPEEKAAAALGVATVDEASSFTPEDSLETYEPAAEENDSPQEPEVYEESEELTEESPVEEEPEQAPEVEEHVEEESHIEDVEEVTEEPEQVVEEGTEESAVSEEPEEEQQEDDHEEEFEDAPEDAEVEYEEEPEDESEDVEYVEYEEESDSEEGDEFVDETEDESEVEYEDTPEDEEYVDDEGEEDVEYEEVDETEDHGEDEDSDEEYEYVDEDSEDAEYVDEEVEDSEEPEYEDSEDVEYEETEDSEEYEEDSEYGDESDDEETEEVEEDPEYEESDDSDAVEEPAEDVVEEEPERVTEVQEEPVEVHEAQVAEEVPEDPALVQAEEEEGDSSPETREMINKSFRIMYAELVKKYEAAGEKAPDMISELIQVGTQKGIFNIEGLSDTLTIKKKARRKKPLTEHEKNLVLRVVNELME